MVYELSFVQDSNNYVVVLILVLVEDGLWVKEINEVEVVADLS